MSPDREAPFGARLRRLREAAGLTQDELAARAGLTAKGISDLERGARRRPYPHTVRALAEALQLSDHERASLIEAVPRRGPTIDPAATAAHPAGSASRTASGIREVASTFRSVAPLTRLIGRERDLETLLDILDRGEVRLVTLTGPGGTGKTSLALEAARRAAGSFRDGAAIVALAPVSDPALIAATIATTLGLQDRATSASEAVRAHLHDKHLLLVLDNVEHLLGAAPQLADLVRTCPQVTVLSTSRAPLRVRGEQELPVPPLPLPAATPLTVADLVDAPSARLFVERAQATSPAFAVTPDNTASIAAICRRVAGLPLALELAAVGTRFLDPAALLARLDRALSAGAVRDLPARQQTMVATLDWSHQLLSVAEAVLFRRLSVFTGDFTLESAEAVGAAADGVGPEAGTDVVVTLGRLVEQSLVLFDARQDGTGRYRMLEPVRDYALDKLDASGETGAIRCAHAGYFTGLGQVAGSELRGPNQAAWLQRLDRDHEELRAALTWNTTTPGAGEPGIRLALALRRYWSVRGRLNEGRRWLQEALDACPAPTPALRAEALEAIATLALEQGDHAVAHAHLAESLGLRTQAGDDRGIATALRGLAETALWQGDHERAALLAEQSIVLLRNAGNIADLAGALNVAGLVEIQRTNHQRALALLTEGLEAARRSGDTWLVAVHLDNLGWAHLGRGHAPAAGRAFSDSLTLCATLTENWFAADCLDGLARLAAKTGDPTRAVRLWAAAERLCTAIGATTKPLDDVAYQQNLTRVRAHLGGAAFDRAWVDGQTLDADEARTYALEPRRRYPEDGERSRGRAGRRNADRSARGRVEAEGGSIVGIGCLGERTDVREPDVASSAQTKGAPEALRLPDGRVLAWSRWGPGSARPVIFCTGAGMSGSLGFGLPTLPALGLQLVAIDRPGLGRSSPHPTKTLQTWLDDVAHLMTSHGLHDGLAVGFSQGAPFALALAGAGLVDAVAVVAGQDEFRAVRHLLHPEVAAMLASAEADPDGFERTIARDATVDWLWSLIMGMSSGQDRELYTGALGRAYRTALEEGFSQGSAGYARDLRLALGPWPTAPEQITVPVDLWYGGQDTSPVHSPDLGQSLAARFSHGHRYLLPDEGSSLLWTRGADILAALARHAGFGTGAR